MASLVHEPLHFQRRGEPEMVAAAAAFYQALRTRRTVRDFAPDPVPRPVIENCIRAAGTAPNGANLQPWKFVAISDPDLKRRIRAAAEQEEQAFYDGRAPVAWRRVLAPLGTGPQKPFLETAPWLIAIFQVNSVDGPDGKPQPTYHPKESVGIATGFLIAALHAAGVATLTHTPSPMGFLNELLRRPANEKPFLLLVAGFPAEGAQVPAITKKPLESIATFL